MGFKLKSTQVQDENKPWADETKTVYVMAFSDETGWEQMEIPFWAKKLWKEFAEANADAKGNVSCQYRRVQVKNTKGKLDFMGNVRMDNQPEFRIED